MDAVSTFHSITFDMRTLNEFYLISFLVYCFHRYFILFSFVSISAFPSPLLWLLSSLPSPSPLFYRTHRITSSHNNVPHLLPRICEDCSVKLKWTTLFFSSTSARWCSGRETKAETDCWTGETQISRNEMGPRRPRIQSSVQLDFW